MNEFSYILYSAVYFLVVRLWSRGHCIVLIQMFFERVCPFLYVYKDICLIHGYITFCLASDINVRRYSN